MGLLFFYGGILRMGLVFFVGGFWFPLELVSVFLSVSASAAGWWAGRGAQSAF